MSWFNVRSANPESKSAELMISGKIGKSLWDDDTVAANDFIKTVNALGDIEEITILLNSPGGSVSDGVAIYNYLKRHNATVNIEVLSEASSIASVILQAGDVRSVPKNALIMVHDPMAPLMGMFNSTELRNLADKLDVVRDSILPSYADNNSANMSSDDIQEMLSKETYMTGEEAVEKGFADNLLDAMDEVAFSSEDDIKAMMTDMAKSSCDFLKANMPEPPVNVHELAMNLCNEAGFPSLAVNIVGSCKTKADIESKVAFATEIQNICASSDLGVHTQNLLAHIDSPAEMLKEVINICQAEGETLEIDDDDLQNKSAKTVISHRDIYQNRNQRGKNS